LVSTEMERNPLAIIEKMYILPKGAVLLAEEPFQLIQHSPP
jgi:hypothetical protein